MDLFSGHKLEQNEDGYTLILYINTNMTEFGEELFGGKDGKNEKINRSVQKYIKENVKDVRINSAKLMIGGVLVATLMLSGKPAFAAELTTPPAYVQTVTPSTYTVISGDTLWKVSQRFGVSIDTIRRLNNLTSDNLYIGQVLKLSDTTVGQTGTTGTQYEYYTVQSGDSLWAIATKFGLTVDALKRLNNLTTDSIYVGQKLKVKEITVQNTTYTVQSGDTLWIIAQRFGTTVTAIRTLNNLTTDSLSIGQRLLIPAGGTTAPTPPPPPAPTPAPAPAPVYSWPDVTYIVQPGDTVTSVAAKFGTTIDNVLKYNYMTPDQWLDAGDKIAISGYAPRTYTVRSGEAAAPAQVGKLVDWVTEGQYLIKRGDEFTIVDVDTGKQFRVKMMGGYNHSDIEPLTTADTDVVKSLFGVWQWSPRAVVIYKDGMNIAGSLSGMPHSFDSLAGNGVSGHFDLYMLNSSPHSETASLEYLAEHKAMVLKAAGQ